MAVSPTSGDDGVTLERLYSEHIRAVEEARMALQTHGINSEPFRKSEGKAGATWRQIREALGAATDWDEWE